MSMWPLARLTDFVAGNTPAVGADNFLNPSQDTIVQLARAQRSAGFQHYDDFTGKVLDTGKWTDIYGGGIVDDSANGADGCCKVLDGQALALGCFLKNVRTADFHFFFRMRDTMAGGGASMTMGLDSVTPAQKCYLSNAAAGNWQAQLGTASPHDLTIARAATYKAFDVLRVSGTVYFLIDGDVLYTVNFPTDLAAGSTFSVSVAGGDAYLDKAALWFGR